MENRNILTTENIPLYGLIVLSIVLTRLLPHPYNFTPVAAISLFAGAHIKGKQKYLLPMVIMLISDLFLGFHSTMIFVYGAFILSVCMGNYLKKADFFKVSGVTLASSILFFLITNFGVWLMNSMYPHTLAGLIEAYVMGIPFFRNTMLGDLVYVYAFFYGYAFISNIVLNKFSYKIRS